MVAPLGAERIVPRLRLYWSELQQPNAEKTEVEKKIDGSCRGLAPGSHQSGLSYPGSSVVADEV